MNELLLTFLFVVCVVAVFSRKVETKDTQEEKEEQTVSTVYGNLIPIKGNLLYDAKTRICYIKYENALSPYCASNGFPYKYNPELEEFEKIAIKIK